MSKITINIKRHTTVEKVDSGFFRKGFLISAVAALISFYYAHAEFGVEKFFYVPCGITLFFSLGCRTKIDKIDILLYLVILLTLISCLINNTLPDQLNSAFFRMTFGILCFYKLRKFDITSVINFIAKISPFIILSYYVLSPPFANPLVRYGGFSGDPNYLAISLNLLIAINFIHIHSKATPFYWKILSAAAIISTLPLFIAGQSRMGIIAAVVMFIFYLIFLYNNNKKAFLSLTIAGFLLSGNIYVAFYDSINNVVMRFSMERRADKAAAMSRFDQIDGALTVLNKYPHLAITGIGINTNPLERFKEYRAATTYSVHNTYMSVLFHQGVIVFILFAVLVKFLFSIVLTGDFKWIKLGLLCSLLLNIASVTSMTYLSFWWSLFFLLNKKI